MVGQQACPDCGMTFKKFWKEKFGTKRVHVEYRKIPRTVRVMGTTLHFTTYEPIQK